MAVLPALAGEIWGLILDQVYLDSPQAVGSVYQASKKHKCLAAPYVYRSIHVRRLHVTSVDDQKSEYIKEIQLNARNYTKEIIVDTAIKVNLFVNLILEVKRLEQLRWQYWKEPIPMEVLEVLPQHPSRPRLLVGELRARSASGVSPSPAHFETFPRLLHCKSLDTIDVKLDDKNGRVANLLKDVIISCPNLRVLRLNLSSQLTLRLNSKSHSSWHFGLGPDDMLPPIQELVLSGYNGEWPRDMVKYDYWNWSKLKVLKLQNSQPYSILQSVQNLQLSLDTLVYDDPQEYVDKDWHFWDSDNNHADWPPRHDAEDLLHDFIANCSGIKNLHVACVRGRLPLSTITNFGSTLVSLTTREYSRWDLREKSLYEGLSAEDLNILNENCPHLESLAIDMQRSAEWDDDFIDALSRFERLRTLRLYIGLLAGPKFTRAGINAQYTRSLYDHFGTCKVGAALKVLYVSAAEPIDDRSRRLLSSSVIIEREFKCYHNDAKKKIVVEDSKRIENKRKLAELKNSHSVP